MALMGIIETLVVKSRYHGLTCTSCRYNQILITLMYLTFYRQFVEDSLLVRQYMIFLQNTAHAPVYFISFCYGSHETVIVIVLEIVAVPICVECGESFLNDMRILLICNTHVPLQPLCQSRARHIRGTNVCRIHTTLSDKNIRLSM